MPARASIDRHDVPDAIRSMSALTPSLVDRPVRVLAQSQGAFANSWAGWRLVLVPLADDIVCKSRSLLLHCLGVFSPKKLLLRMAYCLPTNVGFAMYSGLGSVTFHQPILWSGYVRQRIQCR